MAVWNSIMGHQAIRSFPNIAMSLDRIAIALEKQNEQVQVSPDQVAAVALWREEVLSQHTLLGFSDWLSWHTKEE